eukprot:3590931-Amphidinium_carterae.1
MARRPFENEVREKLMNMTGGKVVIVLPGTTIPGGTQKDRRRTNAAVSLMTSLTEKGVQCFLCLPRSSPCLLIPEIIAVRARKECQTGVIDLCALGAKTCKEGRTYPMKKQYCVLYLNQQGVTMKFSRCTCGDSEHAWEQETREQPRPSMVQLAEHLIQTPNMRANSPQVMLSVPPPSMSAHSPRVKLSEPPPNPEDPCTSGASSRDGRQVTFASDEVGKGVECSFPSTSSGSVSRVPLSQLYPHCPGCRGHKSSLDSSHTRTRGECRWHDEEEALIRARASTSRVSLPRTRIERVPESRHSVPMTSEAASSVSRDVEGTSHAGGSMHRPGLPDEVMESEERRIDEQIDQLLRDALPLDEWIAKKDEQVASATFDELRQPDDIDLEQPDDRAIVERDVSDEQPPHVSKRASAGRSTVATQASDPDDAPEWSAWDLKKVAKILRKDMPVQAIRAVLRRLHVRWWHASKERMHDLLRTAGASREVLDQVDPVCSTCSICRSWKRPHDKVQTSSRLSHRFNETIQADVMFIERKPILHVVDEATRFSSAVWLHSTGDQDMILGLHESWLRTFGPPKELRSDQEAGFRSDWAGVQLARWGINRILLPDRMHASVVERHHAVVRNTFLKVRAQLEQDGLPSSPHMVLSETIFAKNAMTLVGGYTPYSAVFGRTPPLMLVDFETAHMESLQDDGADQFGLSCKIRELAVASMAQAIALDRVTRAAKEHGQASSADMNLEIGALVDYYRTLVGKERAGWRRPAKVVDLTTAQDGIMHISWQGRILSVSTQDVRPHVVLLTWLSLESHVHNIVIQYAESLDSGHVAFFIHVLTPGSEGTKVASKCIRDHPQVWSSMKEVASLDFGITTLTGAMVGRGCRKLPGVPHVANSVMIAWIPGKASQHSEFELAAGKQIILSEALGTNWRQYCVVLFLNGATDEEEDGIQTAINLEPETPETPQTSRNDEHMTQQETCRDRSRSRSIEPDRMEMSDTMPPTRTDRTTLRGRSDDSERSRSDRRAPRTTTPSEGEASMSQDIPMSRDASVSRDERTRPRSEASRSRSRDNGIDDDSDHADVQDRPRSDASRSRDDDYGDARNRPRSDASRSRDDDIEDDGMPEADDDLSQPGDTLARDGNRPRSDASRSRDDSVDSVILAVDACLNMSEVEHVFFGMLGVCGADDACTDSDRREDHDPTHKQDDHEWFLAATLLPSPTNGLELTDDDLSTHADKIRQADLQELGAFVDHEVLEEIAPANARNIIDGKWVRRWKFDAKGDRNVKSRFCLRGFRDKQKDSMNTAAFTASRMTQKIVTSMSVLVDHAMISLDISTAFLQGHAFEQDTQRMVCVRVPNAMVDLLRTFPRFKNLTHGAILRLRKPAYGLVDAPRAWYKALTDCLVTLGWKISLMDPALLYLVKNGVACGFMSLHVDDLKVCASTEDLTKLENSLTKRFGKLKRQSESFEHCGVWHMRTEQGWMMTQDHYLTKLDLPSRDQLKTYKEKATQKCNPADHKEFRTLLGRVAWIVTSRPEAAVMAQTMQAKAHEPTYSDMLTLCLTARWLKSHRSSTLYAPMEGPFRLVVVSDAAFKPEENSKHARRGALLLLTPRNAWLGGRVHIIDYASKKIPRVTKSTYAAELHALCTGTDQAILVSSQYEQFFNSSWHGDLDSFEMKSRRDSLYVPVELAIDAWSVYMSLTSEDIRAPEERPLLLLLWHVRERMARGLIKSVH